MSIRRRVSRRLRGRRGQALAEMALILPILLLLVFGMIEMSNAWRTFQIVTNSAREGARVAILTTSNEADIRLRVQQAIERGGLNAGLATVTVQCFEANGDAAGAACTTSGQEARIRVAFPFTFQVLGRLGGLAPITIASTSTMRHE
jgi:Flp pilus assembly protein TadG